MAESNGKEFDIRFLCLDAKSNSEALSTLKNKVLAVPKEKRKDFLNQKDETGNRPLFYATIGRSNKAIEFLVSEGADPNKFDNDGHCPLYYCTAEKDHLETAKCLLEQGADPNFVRVPDGISPIYWATCSKKPDIVKLLWQRGGNPRIPTTEGKVALNIAVSNGCCEARELLCNMYRCLDLKEEKKGAVCANCKNAAEKLRRCGKCSAVLYCSKDCQIADWKKAHKSTCKGFVLARVDVDTLKEQQWMVNLSNQLGALTTTAEDANFKSDVSHHIGKQFIVRANIAELLNNVSNRDQLIMVYCQDKCRTYWISRENDKETYEKMYKLLRATEGKNVGYFWAKLHDFEDPSIEIFHDRPSHTQDW